MSATTIIPRWEWRSFAPSLAALAEAVHLRADATPNDSDEIYILDLLGGTSDNVKIRAGMLDIKRLRRTGADGLEQWEPVLKATFPLKRSDVAAACRDGPPPREAWTIAQFLEFVAQQPRWRAVDVHKSRRSGVFGGCLAEHARLTVDGTVLETFSLEAEDPARVLAALVVLGLDSHGNTNYPLGLRRALGLTPART